MARGCGLLTVFLCVLLMSSWCEALSSNVDDGYGHEDGSFESDNLLKLNNDDVLTLKSSGETTSESSTVSVSDFGAKGDGKTDDTQVCILHMFTVLLDINLFYQKYIDIL